MVETITDAVSIHSIKKAEYARRIAEGRFGHVTLLDHFKSVRSSPEVSADLLMMSIQRRMATQLRQNSLERSETLRNR